MQRRNTFHVARSVLSDRVDTYIDDLKREKLISCPIALVHISVDGGWGLGLVERGEAGHWPIPAEIYVEPVRERTTREARLNLPDVLRECQEAQTNAASTAARMNSDLLRLTADEAADIVHSTHVCPRTFHHYEKAQGEHEISGGYLLVIGDAPITYAVTDEPETWGRTPEQIAWMDAHPECMWDETQVSDEYLCVE